MVYSNDITKDGIVEESRFLTNTNSVQFPIEDITRFTNRGMDRISYLIQTADGRWQWDDSTNNDLPIGTTNIVSGQKEYSFGTDMLKVIKVVLTDANGEKKIITPVDTRDVEAGALIVGDSDNVGTPIRYDKFANSIFLDPVPNYNATNGLEVYFQRNGAYFDTTDTTKVAGFNPQFHRLLPLYNTRDFYMSKDITKVNAYQAQIDKLEEALVDFYSGRNEDEQKSIRTVYARNSFR